jgi:hypothetical protein
MPQQEHHDVSNGQRALWTFLIYTLVGPFLAALAVALGLLLAPPFGLGALLPENAPAVGDAAMGVFVWSAIPAAIAALALVVVVLLRGSFGWLEAAAAGIAGFMLAILASPGALGNGVPFFAFVAGLVAVGVRQILVAGRILDS